MLGQTLLPGKCEHGVLSKAETGEMEAIALNAVKNGMWTQASGHPEGISGRFHLRMPQLKASTWPELTGAQRRYS